MSQQRTIRTRTLATAVAAVLALGAAAASAQPAATQTKPKASGLPSADDVLARADKAMGADAVAKYDNRVITQKMNIPAQGLSMAITVYLKSPNLMLTRMTMPGLGDMKMGFDGTTGWATDPMQGPRLLSDEELEQLRESPEIGGGLASVFSKAELLGEEQFEGRACWKVALKSESGRETIGFFDKETHLPVGMQGKQKSPMGEVPYTAVMADYEVHHGMKLPARTTMKALGMEQVITLESVQVDVTDLPSFAPPPEVAALQKGGE